MGGIFSFFEDVGDTVEAALFGYYVIGRDLAEKDTPAPIPILVASVHTLALGGMLNVLVFGNVFNWRMPLLVIVTEGGIGFVTGLTTHDDGAVGNAINSVFGDDTTDNIKDGWTMFKKDPGGILERTLENIF